MPVVTRRRFCAGTALAGASLVAGCDPGGRKAQTLAGYTTLVGSAFTIRDPAGPARSLRLARIHVHKPPIRLPVPRGEAFTLVFEATQPGALAQDTHRVSHPELGDFQLFLVPRQTVTAAGLPTFAASFCRL